MIDYQLRPAGGLSNISFESISRKYVEKFQVSLKSETNNKYFTCIPMYIYDNISLNSS